MISNNIELELNEFSTAKINFLVEKNDVGDNIFKAKLLIGDDVIYKTDIFDIETNKYDLHQPQEIEFRGDKIFGVCGFNKILINKAVDKCKNNLNSFNNIYSDFESNTN